ncbi:MAG TPA: phasin family protein [Burkholderiales bacterium]|jgi:phasin family protein|nr:phasin family protein [Burkholderiales bacterium]
MFKGPYPELNKNSLENVLRFTKITMESAERLVKLQLEAAKQAVEENAKNAKSLSELKDLGEVMALRAKLAESGVEKALNFSRSVYEVASQTQAELTKLFEESLSAYTKDLVNVIEKTTKSAPGGSDLALAALKSTIAATQAAVDGMTKAAKEVSELAGTGIKSANSASSTTKSSSKKGR